jgi:hypothetical protein
MKYYALLLFFISSQLSYALTFEIIGPCKETPLAQGYIENINVSENVGEITINILNDYQIPYVGDADAIASIFDYSSDYELLSKTSGRAHGWCYEVDGQQPDVVPSDYFVENKDAHIKWIFGYSTFVFNPDTKKSGWIGYCDPTYKVKPKKICPEIF